MWFGMVVITTFGLVQQQNLNVQCHGTAVVKFLERLTTVFLKDCLGFKPSNFFAYIARR
nr:MAG TPA: hypothetical protein [Caudoviricetes sp.]